MKSWFSSLIVLVVAIIAVMYATRSQAATFETNAIQANMSVLK